MLDNILTLDGIKKLERKEQRGIQGGRAKCTDDYGNCIKYGRFCAELECVWGPLD
ncbi:hypothetical protein [Flavobacterium sp. 316]|uniref:hypothetical protein n=1 Tax=Flavobacterium sp. 316 TaxID=1603293 RepID=UPI000AAD57B6|nr:hypothetical protein [Flavobacterium sp. 316]